MNRSRGRVVRWFVPVVLATVLAACGPGRADFENRHVSELTRALRAGGLEVCSVAANPDGLANQAISTKIVDAGIDCHDERVSLIVDRFAEAEDRDQAARTFEAQARPRGDGVVWTWGPFTIFAVGDREDSVMDRLTEALDRLGAV